MLSSLYAIANPSVCLFVCPSHGWISRKRSKLGSCNFHRTVAPSLSCLRYKFHPEIPTGSPRAGPSNNGGSDRRGNKLILRFRQVAAQVRLLESLLRKPNSVNRQVAVLSRANPGVSSAFLFVPGVEWAVFCK